MSKFFSVFAPAFIRSALLILACLLPQVAPAGTIFWNNNGTVYRANEDGSGASAIITGSSRFDFDSLWATSSYLYWSDRSASTLMRSKLDGSEVTTLITFIDPLDDPFGIQTNATHIYWGEFLDGKLFRANLDGTDVNEIAVGGISTDTALTNSHIYWGRGNIYRSDLDGSNTSLLIPNSSNSFDTNLDFTIGPDGIYFITSDEIYKTDIDGNNPTLVHDFPDSMHSFHTIQYIGGTLFWNEYSTSKIYSGTISGGSLTGITPIITSNADLMPSFAVLRGAPEPAEVFAFLGLLVAAGCGLREWRRRKAKVLPSPRHLP